MTQEMEACFNVECDVRYHIGNASFRDDLQLNRIDKYSAFTMSYWKSIPAERKSEAPMPRNLLADNSYALILVKCAPKKHYPDLKLTVVLHLT